MGPQDLGLDHQILVGIGSTPIVMALVEGVKLTYKEMDPRWHFVVSIVCGVVWNVSAAALLHGDVRLALLAGCVSGLMASGLYSGVKNTVGPRNS